MTARTLRQCHLLNAYRAANAERVLAAYRAGDDQLPRDVLCELVADLGHFCDANHSTVPFEHLIDRALTYWRAEREEVGP